MTSTVTPQVTPIEGIDEESTPPCDMWRPHPDRCGEPSVARMQSRCSRCQGTYTGFTCAECLDIITSGSASCLDCLLATGLAWQATPLRYC